MKINNYTYKKIIETAVRVDVVISHCIDDFSLTSQEVEILLNKIERNIQKQRERRK